MMMTTCFWIMIWSCLIVITRTQYKNQVYSVMRCNGEKFDTQLCVRPGTSISIIDAYNMVFLGHPEKECKYDQPVSGNPIKKPYYRTILNKCSHKQACIDLEAKPNSEDPDGFLVLHYICIEDDIHQYIQCIGMNFTEILCPEGSVIEIVNAFYGVMEHPKSATCSRDHASWFDCKFTVEDNYLGRIKRACNNKTTCDTLTVECNTGYFSETWTRTCSFPSTEPVNRGCADYIMLAYRCHVTTNYDIFPRNTSEMFPTEAIVAVKSTSSEAITGVCGEPHAALIVGVSLGACLAGVIIALMVVVTKFTKSNDPDAAINDKRPRDGPEHPTSTPLYANACFEDPAKHTNVTEVSQLEKSNTDFTVIENENYSPWKNACK